MPTTFIDPTDISIRTYLQSGSLRVECEGTTLPVSDQDIICEVSAGASVPFSLEFDDSDTNRTVSASHYDSAAQLVNWTGANPCAHTFGLTGGFVDVTVLANASGQGHSTVIRIKIKPKTDKPFRG